MKGKVMLDLEVTLTSLVNNRWEISLGSPFCHCVAILRQLDTEIKDIQVWYSDQNPLQNDLVLNLSKDGIRLIFDPYTQRLKMIEVYDMDKVCLRYHGKHFNSPTVPPTIEQINQSFGSTTPCKHDENKQICVMNYRGLAFFFTTDNTLQPKLEKDIGFQRIELPPGIMPKVSKLQIYHGTSVNDIVAPEMPLSIYNGVCFVEKAEVVRSEGRFQHLSLTLRTAQNNSDIIPDSADIKILNRKLHFGLSCQEVASELGAPAKIFYKCDDKMRIHSPDADRNACGVKSDYIYNYFSLGIDVVFDGAAHTVKKIILHTNYPGHYDFNIYMRCDFVLPLTVDIGTEHRMSNPYQSDQLKVSPYTKWNDIEQYCERQKPVVLHRTPSVNSTNPFGPTFCYGVQDMIFEVMKNRHIASIILYQLPTH